MRLSLLVLKPPALMLSTVQKVNGDDTSGQVLAWEMPNCVAAELFQCRAVSLQDITVDAQRYPLIQTSITGAGIAAEAQNDSLVQTPDQVPAWEISDCVAEELFPCRAAGQFQLLLLQHGEHDDVRTTIEE